MVEEINNLDKLLDKLYNEGLQKAQKESASLLEKTKKDCAAIRKEAQEEAHSIMANAQREAARTTKSAENELRLKGKQLLSDLKSEIENMLSKKILETNVTEAFMDASFLKAIIKEAIEHWQSSDELELTLPQNLEEKIGDSLAHSISDSMDGLTIHFSNTIKGGFRIARRKDTYQVSFTEDDFINLLRTYLTEQTDKLLFAG